MNRKMRWYSTPSPQKKQRKQKRQHTFDISIEQLEILQQKLLDLWTDSNICQMHIDLFQQYIKRLNHVERAKLIAKEINQLENKRHLIQKIEFSINQRQNAIVQLQGTAGGQVQITKDEIVSLLHAYRQWSIKMMKNYLAWREQMQLIELFYPWQDTNYLQLMKTDINFLKDAVYLNQIQINTLDPFLFNLSKPYSLSKKDIHVPLNPKLLSTVSYYIQILNNVYSQPEQHQLQSDEECQDKDIYFNPKYKKEVIKEKKYILMNLSNLIVEDYYLDLFSQLTTEISIQSIKEVVSASLVLYSSQILDDVIVESLKYQIPEVAFEAYEEIIDADIVDIRNGIIEISIQDLLKQLITEMLNKQLTVITGETLISQLIEAQLIEQVNLAILEQQHMDDTVCRLLTIELIGDIVAQDWFEIEIEDILQLERLDHVRADFPQEIQTEIWQKEKHKIIDRMSEDIYHNLVNNSAGSIWLEDLITQIIQKGSNTFPKSNY